MAVTRISQSSLKQGLKKNKNFVAGIPPVLGRYYALASETVGAGGAASIEFTNIPQTYKHLQIRLVGRDTRAITENNGSLRFNGNTSSVYSYHRIYGDGSSAAADGGGGQNRISAIGSAGSSVTANAFGLAIIDILDYSNTSKYTTVRSFTGIDRNGGGYVLVNSGLYQLTDAITSALMYLDGASSSWAQYSSAALYGVK